MPLSLPKDSDTISFSDIFNHASKVYDPLTQLSENVNLITPPTHKDREHLSQTKPPSNSFVKNNSDRGHDPPRIGGLERDKHNVAKN